MGVANEAEQSELAGSQLKDGGGTDDEAAT